MLFRYLPLTVALAASLITVSTASAQFYGNDGCSSCGTPAPAITSCAPVQPVYSSCYQTVPVTTYRQEKQTVKVPYYKTSYENRDVTVYEPVTESRTVSVPTVSYKTVYDNRTINKDNGRWQTNYHPVAKRAPCQVDPRPGMIGWLNRTGYSFRSAFVPNYRTTRQYVPNMLTCNVRVPRQVAVHGTKQVVQNFTKMVAKRTTERVAVRKLAYKEQEITVSRPVTAYQTVPIGTSLAYGYGGYGYPSSAVAFGIEEDDTSRTARRPEADPAFEDGLKNADETFKDDGALRQRSSESEGRFQRSSLRRELQPVDELKQPSRAFPAEDAKPDFDSFNSSSRRHRYENQHAAADRRRSAPRGWAASRTSVERTAGNDRLANSSISMTDRD